MRELELNTLLENRKQMKECSLMMKWRKVQTKYMSEFALEQCFFAWQNFKKVPGFEIWIIERSEMWLDNSGLEGRYIKFKNWQPSFIAGVQNGGNPGISQGKFFSSDQMIHFLPSHCEAVSADPQNGVG